MRFQQLPEKVRMVFVAGLGSLIGWITYEIVYFLNPVQSNRATVSWLVAFLVGVARQHGLHGRLTFTHHFDYWHSLARAYVFYSVSAALGALVNFALTERLSLHHRVAWLVCLVITALISLLLLKRTVFVPVSPPRV